MKPSKGTASIPTTFAGLNLRSPIIVASGPASHDVKQIRLAEEKGAGGVVLKTVCSEKYDHMRFWPRPRYKLLDWDKQIGGRSKQFTLYSYEQGYSGTMQAYWDFVRISKEKSGIAIVGSAFADSTEDWVDLATRIEENGADAVELDISSPHRPGSLAFETTFVAAIKSVVNAVKIPVWVKLASGPDVVSQSIAAEQCGAAALTLCNRIRGLDVDIESQRPILHGYYAGIGGPWAKYYNYLNVAEAARAVKIPISATSGIMRAEDAIAYVLLGASTLQVLSAIMVNGWDVIPEMNAGIASYMKRKKIASLDQIRGKANKELTPPDQIIRWSGEPKEGPRNEWD